MCVLSTRQSAAAYLYLLSSGEPKQPTRTGKRLREQLRKLHGAYHARHAYATAAAGEEFVREEFLKLLFNSLLPELRKERLSVHSIAYRIKKGLHLLGVRASLRGTYRFYAVEDDVYLPRMAPLFLHLLLVLAGKLLNAVMFCGIVVVHARKRFFLAESE